MKSPKLTNSVRFPHLMKSPILGGLSDDQKAEFLDECETIIFDEQTDVLTQGGESAGMHLIAYGSIEITRNHQGMSGRASLLVVQPGASMGTIEAIADIPVIANATARRGTTLLLCPKDRLREWMSRPEFLKHWMQTFAEQLVQQNENRAMDRSQPIDIRVGRYLLQFADKKGFVDRSQSVLAEVVGCSRQTVNGVIKALKEQGLVERQQQGVRIVDLDVFRSRYG